jgi:Transposase, Mutator family
LQFLRDMLSHVSKAQQPLVSGAIRGVFQRHLADRDRLATVVDQLADVTPKVSQLIEDAEPDLFALLRVSA